MKKKIYFSLILVLNLSCSHFSNNDSQVYSFKVSEKEIRQVPEGFIGFSFEKNILNTKIFHKETNEKLKNLILQVGPGVLRFGGNQSDLYAWDAARSNCKADKLIDQSTIVPLFDFAYEINWKVLYTLNLGCGTIEQAANEAQYVARFGHNQLLAFQIGNEPNLYPKNGLRSADWSVKDFNSEFKLFQTAINKKISNTPISGPAFASLHSAHEKWFVPFLNSSSNLVLLTQHTYQLIPEKMEDRNKARSPKIENLMSTTNRLETFKLAQEFVTDASRKNLSLRISETNSAAGGGKSGVSDVFASSLWALEHLLTLLNAGVSGVDFHGDPNSGLDKVFYSPIKKINSEYLAQPEYYGIYFFKRFAMGKLVDTYSKNTFPIYAFKNNDNITIILINRNSKFQKIQIELPFWYNKLKKYELKGKSLESSENIEITGFTLGNNGLFQEQNIQWMGIDLESEYTLAPFTATALVFKKME